MTLKQNQEVLFYVKRHRCYIKGTVKQLPEFDETLNCMICTIKDETGSNWAVQPELITTQIKKGMKIFNSKTFKIEIVQ